MDVTGQQLTMDAFIDAYIRRARAVGFEITRTADGCVYAAEPEFGTPKIRMVAVPCDCDGHTEGWHMIDAETSGWKRCASQIWRHMRRCAKVFRKNAARS